MGSPRLIARSSSSCAGPPPRRATSRAAAPTTSPRRSTAPTSTSSCTRGTTRARSRPTTADRCTRPISATSSGCWRGPASSSSTRSRPPSARSIRARWTRAGPTRPPLARCGPLHLDGLLVGGPVDPRDQGLGDAAQRAEAHGVEARLGLCLARRVGRVGVGRLLAQRALQRGLEGLAARGQLAAPAEGGGVLLRHRTLEHALEVLEHVAVEALLVGRTEVVAVVVGLVVDLV